MSDRRVVVIGAGPAGLASAAALRRRGIVAQVLDRADAVGSSWRARYDRLRLNSSRPFSKLPMGRFARGTAMFPSRQEVVDYLERYTRRHQLDVRLGVHVERVSRNGGWVVETSAGEMRARCSRTRS
jgi:putative flavoprotein involved in K+ transport